MVEEVTLTQAQMVEAMQLWVAQTFTEGHRQKIEHIKATLAFSDAAQFEIKFKQELAEPLPMIVRTHGVQVPRMIQRGNRDGQPAQTD